MAFATKVMKGIYKDGVIRPLSKLKLPDNFYVTILLSDDKSSNFDNVIRGAHETFSTIRSFSDGVEYTRKIRRGSEARLKEILHE